ncbi:MAG: 1-deoxy-D-xylulose-5-phosphate reductoisomerase [Bacteroides sp.]|nr:1-deoxy-D-xylulose-5-phosphate reductoisomerase [Eubacterium sp.]MCM1418707.1 1-deoxy-D-xylulose-5-phosphate reductoisomerase [Roseburia sp.]MCM1462735.1 1-deoxy-D-xylulose-5-phosphate reductoisomerase [Bacteroides sp.]
MTKEITILGSTGSIGTQTLDVCRLHGYGVRALSARSNAALLERQAREFRPSSVAIATEEGYRELKLRLADTGIKVSLGEEGLREIAALPVDMVVNAVVGMVGLRPTLAAIEAGNAVGLANKETMVVGGELVTRAARERNVPILPIDSEHSAIFQSLLGSAGNRVEKILLTASGGPFFGYTKERLRSVTREQALTHPNWSMGQKITTDSATLMNKGLELIEAVWFFGVPPERVEVIVHRQSILHSAVEFEDGAVIGQLGVPDMKIPIQFALTYPKRLKSASKRLSLTEIGSLTFEEADEETFPCLALAKKAIAEGGNAPCILNSANEVAVAAFLRGELPFYRIAEVVAAALDRVPRTETLTLPVIAETDRAAREAAEREIRKEIF